MGIIVNVVKANVSNRPDRAVIGQLYAGDVGDKLSIGREVCSIVGKNTYCGQEIAYTDTAKAIHYGGLVLLCAVSIGVGHGSGLKAGGSSISKKIMIS